MKKTFLTLLMLFSILVFTSCEKSQEPDNPPSGSGNLFDCTYSITEDGCCVLGGVQPISADVVDKEVKGYGWKVVGMFQVQENGKLSRTDYRKTVEGGGYSDYWFESENHLVGFRHGDVPGKFYKTTEWSYDAKRGFVMRDDATQDKQSRYMQILRFDTTEGIYHQMFTMQSLGYGYDAQGNKKLIYGMVIYLRMTDKELAAMKESYDYDANIRFSGDVPNDCKFSVRARYYNPDDFDESTSGAVIVTFGKVEFTLTDHLGTAILPNPALEYFDSIVWRSNSQYLPDRYVIHRRKQGQTQTVLRWTTYFFDTDPNLTTFVEGYKSGRVDYIYTMRHDIYADKFLCFDWERFASSKPRQFTASCVLDNDRSFTVYAPRVYNGDLHKVYAELRYNSEEKGKGNDVVIMDKGAGKLGELMTNHYGNGIVTGKQSEHYRALFNALPEKADIKHYWETADTRIALVCNHDDTDASGNYYYVHAEPISK